MYKFFVILIFISIFFSTAKASNNDDRNIEESTSQIPTALLHMFSSVHIEESEKDSLRNSSININFTENTINIASNSSITIDSLPNYLKLQSHSISRIFLDTAEDENSSNLEQKYEMLNRILKSLKYQGKLRELHVKGILNQQSIHLIGNLISLESLIFEEGTHINGRDYNTWKNLTNLKILDLENTNFIEDNDRIYIGLEETNMATVVPIALRGFLEAIESMENLEKLNISQNSLFPTCLDANSFKAYISGKQKGGVAVATKRSTACEKYMRWREQQITECAKLLSSNFLGIKLLMKNTCIGDLFIDGYSPRVFINEIDFSDNYISLDSASYFSYLYHKRSLTVNFSKNGYSENELKLEILNRLLNIELICDSVEKDEEYSS